MTDMSIFMQYDSILNYIKLTQGEGRVVFLN